MGFFKARIVKWVAIPSSSGARSVRTLHYDLSSWVALPSMDQSFIELHKPLCHHKPVIYEGVCLNLWKFFTRDLGFCKSLVRSG